MYTSTMTPPVEGIRDKDDVNNTCSLQIDKDPFTVFYKDEGGKANNLVAGVKLPSRSNPGNSSLYKYLADGGLVHLKATLYYQSGVRVEDGDSIFSIIKFEPSVLSSTTTKTELRYRIEKVSRRKDGQRFKVRFDVDEVKSPEMARVLHGAFTTSVLVLSKRKSSASKSIKNGSNASKSRYAKRDNCGVTPPTTSVLLSNNSHNRKRGTVAVNEVSPKAKKKASLRNIDMEKILQRLTEAERSISMLQSTVERQSSRISQLEGALPDFHRHLIGTGSMDPYAIHPRQQVSQNAQKIVSTKAGALGYDSNPSNPFQMDEDMSDLIMPGVGVGEPLVKPDPDGMGSIRNQTVKKLRVGEAQFNFDVPDSNPMLEMDSLLMMDAF